MDKVYAIILTIITGLFFLVGGVISRSIKDKDKLNHFSGGLALIIMLGLIILDLGPEILELLDEYAIGNGIIMALIFIILGFMILKMLDLLVPSHTHKHKEHNDNKVEHQNHLHHIGKLTIISLILHNALEGFMIYGVTINEFKMGLLLALSVILHNLPLGTHIFSTIDEKNNKLLIFLLTFSGTIGSLIFLIVGNVSNLILGVIMAITLGMIIYIALFELLPEVKEEIKKKETIWGLISGIGILIISFLI